LLGELNYDFYGAGIILTVHEAQMKLLTVQNIDT